MASDRTVWVKRTAFLGLALSMALFSFACKPVLITPKLPFPTPTPAPPAATETATLTFTFTATHSPSPTGTFTNTPTATGTITPLVIGPYNCGSGEDTSSFPPSGQASLTSTAADFIPLCNGWILLGDTNHNQVLLYNVLTQSAAQTFALSGAPGPMAYDYANSMLYVGYGSNGLACVNISTSVVFNITLGSYVEQVAVVGPGEAIVSTGAVDVELVKTSSSTPVTTYSLYCTYMDFDPNQLQFFMDNESSSPPDIDRYTLNTSTNTLSLNQSTAFSYPYSYAVNVSPDGNHLAVQRGSSETDDLSASNLGSSFGQMNGTMAYKQAGSFSPDSSYFLTTQGFPPSNMSLVVYGVASHTAVKTVTFGTGGATYNAFTKVGFSHGGKMIYGRTANGTTIFWSLFP